jgi:predicted permease
MPLEGTKVYKSEKSPILSISFKFCIASALVVPIILPCFVFKFKKRNPLSDTIIASVLSLLSIFVVKSVFF